MSTSESTENLHTYFEDVAWARFAYGEITEDSIESKVDHFWISVLRHYFPFAENYFVTQNTLVDSSGVAANLQVRHLRNGVPRTILVMENKRAMDDTPWRDMAMQLTAHLNLVPVAEKGDLDFEIGMVGIGRSVRFYCRRGGNGLEDYPGSPSDAFHVYEDREIIDFHLREIKQRMSG